MKSFGRTLDAAIENGKDLSARLRELIEEALGLRDNTYQTKRNTYIQSFPGAGKTFTVAQVLKENNIKAVMFSGATSMFGFALRLCHAAHWMKEDHIPVIIDDVDALFTGDENLNVMKDYFNPDPVFRYTKAINENTVGVKGNESMVAAIKASQAPGVGIEFDTSRFTTLVLSNRILASTNDIKERRIKNNKQSMGEAAIRDRCIYPSTFSKLTDDENWGWLTSIVLATPHFEDTSGNPFTITDDQKYELMTYLHYHWAEVSNPSMRTVAEFASLMKRAPEAYIDRWKLHLG